jgi:hypothetical protein
VAIWSVAVIGIWAWVWGERNAVAHPPVIRTDGPNSPIVQGTQGDVHIEFNGPEHKSP